MHVYCQHCGAQVIQSAYGLADHECRFEQLLEFQTQCARLELEHRLEAQVGAWEREPHMAKQLAFARYVRERPDQGRRHRRAAA